MAPRAPSRQTLRLLNRLCFFEPSQHRTFATTTLSSRCKRNTAQRHNLVRSAATLRDTPESSTFASDPSHFDPQNLQRSESQRQNTADPEFKSSTPLPDISNYYTLFPQTLPHGPPRPASQTATRVSSSGDIPDQTLSAPISSSAATTSKALFHIDPRTLRSEFLRLQSQHHPDKYPSNTPAHQKAYALSTLLNNAYKTLLDPLLRAQYLLQLNYGIDVMSEDNSEHPTDQETLLEVMEAQEKIEEASRQEEIDALKEQNRARITETEKKMATAFERNDAEAAKEECVRLKYWVSLQQGLDDWEPGKEVRLIH